MRQKTEEYEMVECQTRGDCITISFDKSSISPNELSEFVEKLKVKEMLSKSTLTQDEATMLSDELKESWWSANKERFLSKIAK